MTHVKNFIPPTKHPLNCIYNDGKRRRKNKEKGKERGNNNNKNE